MSWRESNYSRSSSTNQSSSGSKERFSYTPSWMSPRERSILKARIMKLKKRGPWGMKKEEELLQKGSDGRGSNYSQDETSRMNSTIGRRDSAMSEYSEVDPGIIDETQPSTISKDTSVVPPESTPKGVRSRRSSDTNMAGSPNAQNDTYSLGGKAQKSKEELTMAKKAKKPHPKAVHANPTGNVVEDTSPWIPHPKDHIEAHLWATDFRVFDPQLYAFKTPEKLSTKKPVVAECPPFWVLNDHTIAVAWKLFHMDADRSELGIVALEWSREFVCAMKDERGEYPSAIKHLIDAIEDGLIFRYSRAAEDSKHAHQKDDISYASSDSVFKPPTEVSYTLKDILSRNYPGRKFGDEREIVQSTKENPNASAVPKTALVPGSVLTEGESMNQKDLVSLLRQVKIEQEARVKHEMNASKEIDKLLRQAEEGSLPIQTEKNKDHVGFAVPDDQEESFAASKHDAPSKTKSDMSSKSAKSDASTASGKSTRSKKSGKSARSSTSSAASSDMESEASEMSPKAKKRASKDSVREKKRQDMERKKSQDMERKKSKDSVASGKSKASKGSASSEKKKKGSKESGERKSSKDSASSKKKSSKDSASSKKKSSKGSKGSKGSS